MYVLLAGTVRWPYPPAREAGKLLSSWSHCWPSPQIWSSAGKEEGEYGYWKGSRRLCCSFSERAEDFQGPLNPFLCSSSSSFWLNHKAIEPSSLRSPLKVSNPTLCSYKDWRPLDHPTYTRPHINLMAERSQGSSPWDWGVSSSKPRGVMAGWGGSLGLSSKSSRIRHASFGAITE